MNKSILALVLALGVAPLAALAQDTNGPAAPTADQRQAMRQTFEQFGQQEKQLHEQMRSQILSSLSPVHLRAVAATIGDLAIEQSPDPQAAAKRLDQILSPAERQRILAAHSSFAQQSRQLHEQMRTQLQSEMPAGHANWTNHGSTAEMPQRTQFDAGTVLLMALSPHPMLGMMGMAHGSGMMHMEGAPPQ
jgi:hypothetical protein